MTARGPTEVRSPSREDLAVLERDLPLATPERHRECLAQQEEGRLTYLVAWRGATPVGHGLVHWAGPRNPDVSARLPGCPEIFMLGVVEPSYVDRWRWIDAAGTAHVEEDPCEFLVKPLWTQ